MSDVHTSTGWDHDAVTSGVIVCDAEGTIVDVNATAAELAGIPAHAIRGLSLADPSWFAGRVFCAQPLYDGPGAVTGGIGILARAAPVPAPARGR